MLDINCVKRFFLFSNQNYLYKGEGLFLKLEITVNKLDPNFHQSWIRLRRFYCQNQVISKKKKDLTSFSDRNYVIYQKKRSSPKFSQFSWLTLEWIQKKKNSTFQFQLTASPSQLLLANPILLLLDSRKIERHSNWTPPLIEPLCRRRVEK